MGALDRQAALLLTMVVQQGLTPAEKLAVELLRIRRDKRRLFVHGVMNDLLGGLRVEPDTFFAQIGEALAAAGCPIAA